MSQGRPRCHHRLLREVLLPLIYSALASGLRPSARTATLSSSGGEEFEMSSHLSARWWIWSGRRLSKFLSPSRGEGRVREAWKSKSAFISISTLAREHLEDIDATLVDRGLLRVFLGLGLEHGVLLGLVHDQSQRLVVELVADLQPHAWIANEIPVPGLVAGELLAGAVYGGQIELAVLCCAPDRHRMRDEIPGFRLHVDVAILVGEGPVGDGRGDDLSREPQAGPALSRIEPGHAQHDEGHDQHRHDHSDHNPELFHIAPLRATVSRRRDACPVGALGSIGLFNVSRWNNRLSLCDIRKKLLHGAILSRRHLVSRVRRKKERDVETHVQKGRDGSMRKIAAVAFSAIIAVSLSPTLSVAQSARVLARIHQDAAQVAARENQDVQAPRENQDVQAPRENQDVQAPRENQDVQAPRENQDVQAPRENQDVQAPRENQNVQA